MSKYHISKTGKPAICRAKDGNCPLGGADTHFATKDKAQKYIEKLGAKDHGILPTVKPNEAKPTREDKVKQCFEMIEAGVKDVFTSENFKKYLNAVSKFHNYSYNNILLILSQNPGASQVAGFNKWKNDFNRTVNKGEKGIMILAPSTYYSKETITKRDSKGKPIIDKRTGKPETEETTVPRVYFKPAYVFDVSQTDGEPIPKLMEDLQGTSEEAKSLIKSVQEVSAYQFSFVDPNEDHILKSGAKGYCDTVGKRIVINKTLSDTQQAKTVIHEFAHAELHENSTSSREQKEVEAESVAFALSSHFGLDTADYSFPYIATWNGKDDKQLKDILKGVQSRTSEMVGKLEPAFLKNHNKS